MDQLYTSRDGKGTETMLIYLLYKNLIGPPVGKVHNLLEYFSRALSRPVHGTSDEGYK